MSGPKARSYKAGSIVYFENDVNANEIYVLHSGRVILITTNVVTGEEEKEEIQRGEFFGVKSALGRYRREETAQVLGNSVVLVFTVPEFEALSMRNIPLTMKMLRVFSKQLRNIHRQVREVLGETEIRMPATELLNVADYYYRHNDIDKAIYAYERYIHHYPSGKYVDRANEMLGNCRKGMPYPQNAQPLDADVYTPESETINQMGSMPAAAADSGGGAAAPSLMNILYEGLTAFANQNFDDAIAKYQAVIGRKKVSGGEELKAVEKAHYELGRANLGKGEPDKALEIFQNYLKKFPSAEQSKSALLHIAEIYDQKGLMQKAVSFYNKVITIPPNDGDSAKAKARLKKLTS